MSGLGLWSEEIGGPGLGQDPRTGEIRATARTGDPPGGREVTPEIVELDLIGSLSTQATPGDLPPPLKRS